MQFFYITYCNGVDPRVGMTEQPSRERFLRQLKLDNGARISQSMGWTFEEIPVSCVNKLFPHADWKLHSTRSVPADKTLTK